MHVIFRFKLNEMPVFLYESSDFFFFNVLICRNVYFFCQIKLYNFTNVIFLFLDIWSSLWTSRKNIPIINAPIIKRALYFKNPPLYLVDLNGGINKLTDVSSSSFMTPSSLYSWRQVSKRWYTRQNYFGPIKGASTMNIRN